MNAAIVIGIGNAYRGDDGVGPAVAAAVRRLLPDADVIALDGEPTRLVDAWTGRPLALVVDAIRAGEAPGTLHRLEVGVDALPEPGALRSTHGGGLADAVALGAALGRNPDKLVLFGIEPCSIGPGPGLAAAVAAAVPELARRVAEEVAAACA